MIKHKKGHRSVIPGQFNCDDCGKTFKDKWKLDAHVKIHEKYCCEICEKIFQLEDIREKHKKIAHEGLKIYYCFFNNDAEYPHEDQCFFCMKTPQFVDIEIAVKEITVCSNIKIHMMLMRMAMMTM